MDYPLPTHQQIQSALGWASRFGHTEIGFSARILAQAYGYARQRLLTAAGDDLCRFTQDEIKALTSGAVPIPPEGEFLASCKRFHAQIASEAGVNSNCLTMAQLVAENERQQILLEKVRPFVEAVIHDLENEVDPEYAHTEAQKAIHGSLEDAHFLLKNLP